MEWMAWMQIRGPIGPQRQDYYTSFLAMYAGGPYQKEVKLSEFSMPWIREELEVAE